MKNKENEFMILLHDTRGQCLSLNTSPEQEKYGSYVGRVARGAGIGSIGQVAGRAFGYATQVTLARMYGPALLGFYVLGTTMISVANVLAQFGMDNGVVRYVAHYRADKDIAKTRGVILLALGATFALSLVIAGVLFFGVGFLANVVFDKPSLAPVLRVFSLSLPFLTVMSIGLWSIQGFQTVKYPTYVRQVLQPLANLIFVVAFYLLGAQILGAVAAYVLSMVVGAGFSLYYLKRTFPELLDRAIPAEYEPRALFAASGPMIIANFTPQIGSWTTVAVLGVFASGSAVGIYNVAFRMAALSSVLLVAFMGIFSPIVSDLYRRGSREHLGDLYKDVSRWTFIGSLAVFLLTAFLAKDLLAVFGKAFIPGWTAMILMSAAELFNSSIGLAGRMLAMTGHQKILMLYTVGATIVGIAVNFALVPSFGFMGAAVATATATILMNAFALLSVRRLLGFWPYSRQYMKPIVAGALAIAGAYLFKLVLPLQAGITTLVVIAPLFVILFAILLFALGLGDSDRQLLMSFWTAVRRNVRREN